MTAPAAILAFCRFGQDAAATLLWGASAYLWALVPPTLGAAVALRLRHCALAMITVVLLAVAVKLPTDVAGIGDGWADALDPAMLRSVLLHTSPGRAWIVQAACASLLVAAAAVPRRRRVGAVAVASGLLLASLSLEGHAASQQGWLGLLLRANDVLHVWSGGAWLGSLVPVLVILPMSLRSEWQDEAAAALRGFSRIGHVAVALVLASGALATVLISGRWPIDPASPYQMLLDLKIACVLAMTGLALVNRYILVPRMTVHPAGAGRALRLATLAEVPLGLAALGLVAVFGQLDPS